MLGQEAIDVLLKDDKNESLLDIYVCDANIPPPDSLAMLRQAGPLMKRGAFVVVTFKNPYKRKKDWYEAKKDSFADFSTMCDAVTEVHNQNV
mmetsp:Transcript_17015/g.14190  ORF Transcript_17015/g.14190 Transcript_17015/m.14190 type:complete len:92 (-) Transcript_17015:53-328(-)